jgi:hypothetical protein
MNNKPGLSITQHKDLGKRLKRVRTELVDIGLLLAEAYPSEGRHTESGQQGNNGHHSHSTGSGTCNGTGAYF